MCKVMEDMRNESKAEGIAEGQYELLERLIAAGKLTAEDAAEFAPAAANQPETAKS